MSKVAIVGVEGSGKTVLMASLSECYGTISGDEPYLMPENQSAYLFMHQVPHRLRVDREWPGATGIDALRTMKWTLRHGQKVLNTIEMLDYPGELYRVAFGERTAEEVAAHRAELDEFLEHLTDADTLIVLFNLADVENQGANARNAETVWITRGIFDYAAKLPNLKRRHLVFTQADRYAGALKEAGGAAGLYARKLPMLKVLYPDLPVTAIAAVDGMDGEGRPKPGYSAASCRELMRVILSEQDELAKSCLRACQGRLDLIPRFAAGSLGDFAALVDGGVKTLNMLKAESLPLKSFYAKDVLRLEEKLGYWCGFFNEVREIVKTRTIEQLATPEAWAKVRAEFKDSGNILTVFQRGYAESVARVRQQEEEKARKILDEEEEARRMLAKKAADAKTGKTVMLVFGAFVLMLVVVIIGVNVVEERARQERTVVEERARQERTVVEERARQERTVVEERARQERTVVEERARSQWKETTANLKAGDTKAVDLGGEVVMEFVWCPPGTFQMGSTVYEQARESDEIQHQVTLKEGFWMGKTEVTQAQWEQVMRTNPSNFKDARSPVENVSWDDCKGYIQKLNEGQNSLFFRLPTEAEWEYACRAGSTAAYGGTGDLDEMGWYTGNSGSRTHPVGQKKPNAWGLYDMHGNVWEWCQDWYGDYSTLNAVDPAGPGSGLNRVIRGGGWSSVARRCRSANRGWDVPGYRRSNLGFRLVMGRP